MKITLNLFIISFLSLFSIITAADNTLTDAEKADNWQLLFDGKSIAKHWKTYGEEALNNKWLVKDGMFGIPANAGANDIITKEHYTNFEFKIDWKISKAGNSGIFLRVDETGKKAHSYALEVQILDDPNFKGAKGNSPTDKQKSGSIYDILAAKSGVYKGHDKWQTTHVIAKDKKISVYMNGELVADLDLDSETYKKLFNVSKFAKNPKLAEKYAKGMSGPIGLQDHKSEIWFKNAKIKKL